MSLVTTARVSNFLANLLFQGQSDIEYPIDDETIGCVLDVECWEKDVWFVIFKDLINDIPHVRIVRVRYPLVNNHALAELAVRQLSRERKDKCK